LTIWDHSNLEMIRARIPANWRPNHTACDAQSGRETGCHQASRVLSASLFRPAKMPFRAFWGSAFSCGNEQ
jgi:hypothetical protein